MIGLTSIMNYKMNVGYWRIITLRPVESTYSSYIQAQYYRDSQKTVTDRVKQFSLACSQMNVTYFVIVSFTPVGLKKSYSSERFFATWYHNQSITFTNLLQLAFCHLINIIFIKDMLLSFFACINLSLSNCRTGILGLAK